MTTRIEAPVSLEPGDHLTREEFHRRYCARPDIKRAELVEGVVYLPSPVRFGRHAEQTGAIVLWLGTYAVRTTGVRFGNDGTLLLDDGNEPQPDALLWRPEASGAHLNADGYIVGAPPLVVEVAASSVSYDLHEKKEAYRRNGVGEYIVWRVLDRAIDWFRLVDGTYVTVEPEPDGIVESNQFPGLRLHVPSMLAGDVAGVLAALDPTAPA
jgi:Uma2 family endonuclease